MTESITLTSEEAVAAGLQSLNWEKYDSHQFADRELIREGHGELLPKPKNGEDGRPQKYDLITRSGQRCMGTPRPYSPDPSVHDEWTIEVKGVKEKRYEDLSSFAIIAWREHQDPPAEAEQK